MTLMQQIHEWACMRAVRDKVEIVMSICYAFSLLFAAADAVFTNSFSCRLTGTLPTGSFVVNTLGV